MSDVVLSNSNPTTLTQAGYVFDPYRDAAGYTVPTLDPQWGRALETVAPTVTEKIETQARPGESWADTLQRMLPMLAMTIQQREILQIQMERARQGLPPLPNSEFGAQVNVGIDSQTRKALLIGGVALAGVLAFVLLKRRG